MKDDYTERIDEGKIRDLLDILPQDIKKEMYEEVNGLKEFEQQKDNTHVAKLRSQRNSTSSIHSRQ